MPSRQGFSAAQSLGMFDAARQQRMQQEQEQQQMQAAQQQAAQQQQYGQDIGMRVAGGDLSGAETIALKHGDMDQASQLRNRAATIRGGLAMAAMQAGRTAQERYDQVMRAPEFLAGLRASGQDPAALTPEDFEDNALMMQATQARSIVDSAENFFAGLDPRPLSNNEVLVDPFGNQTQNETSVRLAAEDERSNLANEGIGFFEAATGRMNADTGRSRLGLDQQRFAAEQAAGPDAAWDARQLSTEYNRVAREFERQIENVGFALDYEDRIASGDAQPTNALDGAMLTLVAGALQSGVLTDEDINRTVGTSFERFAARAQGMLSADGTLGDTARAQLFDVARMIERRATQGREDARAETRRIAELNRVDPRNIFGLEAGAPESGIEALDESSLLDGL